MYVPACIASTVWIYKNGTDYAILAFATMFFCILCYEHELTTKQKMISIFSIGFLQMSRVIVYIGVTLWGESAMARDLLKGSEGVVLLILGIIFTRMWVNTPLKKRD